jgi:hypothetical protein
MSDDYVIKCGGSFDHLARGVSRLKNALPLTVVLLLAGTSADAATIAPHRAIYDLTLLRTKDGANLQSANGRLAFEVQGSSCEGYTVNFRMAAKYRPAEGEVSLIDTQSTTFEGPGGLEFRHQMKELLNGDVRESTKIKLNRDSVDLAGQGLITTKGQESFSIPAGTVLPMQHQLKLMSLGGSGGGRDSSVVFDGSDGAKVFQAISFVGKQKTAGSVAADAGNPVAGPLKSLESWPMTVSYFAKAEDEAEPVYQVSFEMYANGVATGLVLDYGDFALAGKLANLEMLGTPDCQ